MVTGLSLMTSFVSFMRKVGNSHTFTWSTLGNLLLSKKFVRDVFSHEFEAHPKNQFFYPPGESLELQLDLHNAHVVSYQSTSHMRDRTSTRAVRRTRSTTLQCSLPGSFFRGSRSTPTLKLAKRLSWISLRNRPLRKGTGAQEVEELRPLVR